MGTRWLCSFCIHFCASRMRVPCSLNCDNQLIQLVFFGIKIQKGAPFFWHVGITRWQSLAFDVFCWFCPRGGYLKVIRSSLCIPITHKHTYYRVHTVAYITRILRCVAKLRAAFTRSTEIREQIDIFETIVNFHGNVYSTVAPGLSNLYYLRYKTLRNAWNRNNSIVDPTHNDCFLRKQKI